MKSRQDHYRKRWTALKSERSSLWGDWQQLSDNILGHRGRFLVNDRNKSKRNYNILNNTGKLALRTLASGMMAGITSPARPWFKLATPNHQMMDDQGVKQWLSDVERRMREVFNQSNVYNVLHSNYAELGGFGTGVMGVYEDFDNVIRCVPYTVGSYALGTNGRNEVDTFYREYQQSVGQVVSEFGYENCSRSVQQNWDRGNTESWVNILHVVEPNDDRDQQSPMARDKKFRSVYVEIQATNNDQFLKESGFDEFPVMAPRWDVVGGDIYATSCPGMDALGDIKALQLHEKRKSQAIDKLVDPPLQAPISMQSQVQGGGFMPGEIEFVADTGNGIRSIYDFRPDIGALGADIREDEMRVKRAFYEDLFLMLANTDRRQITAREIEEKHEEKLLMLGPVLERLHNELLNPLIKRTFNIMSRAGIFPDPPQALQNTEVKVEYISVLAQAQRLTAVAGIERFSGYVSNMMQSFPEIRHKFDALQSADEYAEAVGISPRMVRDDNTVEQRMLAEQQQQQQAQAMEMAQSGAQTAKTMSETDTESPSALARVMGLS